MKKLKRSAERQWKFQSANFFILILLIPGIITSIPLNNVHRIPRINIVLMIGDGMGTEHINAARTLIDPSQELYLDQFPYEGLVTTASYDNSITDSAAATALATGYKTNNGMVGIDPKDRTLETILEFAQSIGMSTGIVTTTRMTHATPAAFASHVQSRNLEDEIAVSLIYSQVDVLLGGSLQYYLPQDHPNSTRQDDRDLISEAEELGYTYIANRDELLSIKINVRKEKLLGLFALDHLNFDQLRNETLEPIHDALINCA